MAKKKNAYVCNSCSETVSKWQGQCPGCGEWSTLEEVSADDLVIETDPNELHRIKGYAPKSKPAKFYDVNAVDEIRHSTKLREFDTVLGGGLCEGSIIYISGPPGVGKSTLTNQVAANLAEDLPVLLSSAEESQKQITSRARRLGIIESEVDLLIENDVDVIIETAESLKSKVLIVDSLQAVYSPTLKSAIGSLSQMKECAARLTRFAKTNPLGTAVIVIGQIVKSGEAAGPKTIAHGCDAVIEFVGTKDESFRMLSASKNRFGTTDTAAIFSMTEKGLVEVSDPSRMFLSTLLPDSHGSVVTISQETIRPVLTEIQALTDECSASNPARNVVGLNRQRLLMTLAIINQHTELKTGNRDVFVSNIGGLSITEPAQDLAVFAAIISSQTKTVIPKDVAFAGEISLNGEVRAIPRSQSRIREALNLGIRKVVLPKANRHASNPEPDKLIYVRDVNELVSKILSKSW